MGRSAASPKCENRARMPHSENQRSQHARPRSSPVQAGSPTESRSASAAEPFSPWHSPKCRNFQNSRPYDDHDARDREANTDTDQQFTRVPRETASHKARQNEQQTDTLACPKFEHSFIHVDHFT